MPKEEITAGAPFRFVNIRDTIEGKLVAVRDGAFVRPDGTRSKVYDIETENGRQTVFGTTILDRKMSEVKVGEWVTIEYAGNITTKFGRQAKDFKVYRGK